MLLQASHRVFLTCAALAYHLTAQAIAEGELPEQDYSDWYQVEIVVFKPRNKQANDEIWPLTSLGYPKNMVAVGAIEVKPDSIHQLRQLIEFEKMLPGEPEIMDAALVSFLFEKSSRQQRNQQLLQEELQDEILLDTQVEGPEEDEITSPIDHSQLQTILTAPRPEAFRELSTEHFNLTKISGSLRRSSRFDLLTHQAWLQPMVGESTPILVQTGKRYDHFFEVDGTLTFSRSRYLHVDTDLWYTEFTPRYNQQQQLRLNDLGIDAATREAYPELVTQAREQNTHVPLHSYRMLQSRRMRSNETHYLDHPFFGVVIKIVRFSMSNQ